jgi:hypothetical protein
MVSDRQLTLRSCLFGTILGTLGCVIFYYLGYLAVGNLPRQLALFLPDKLGLVDEVDAEDVMIIMPDVENEVLLFRRGKYELYTFDGRSGAYHVAIEPIDAEEAVWVTPADAAISGQARQEAAHGLPEHLVPAGQPASYLAYMAQVNEAGSYRIVATSQTSRAGEENLILVRSVANQNAFVAIFGGLAQIGLVVLAISLVYRFLNRDRLRARQAMRKQKSKTWESVFSDSEQSNGNAS